MANKQYISIIRLFNHCGINANEELNLSRIKKQLVAEFNMSSTGFIEVDGCTYTRNDVLEEIEHPQFAERLKYHQRIWQTPELLNWLEKNQVDFYPLSVAIKPFLGDKAFDQFFSPYLAAPFNYTARNLLNDDKLGEMGKLLAYEDFLQPAEREEGFRPIRIYLDEALRTLRNTNGQNYSMMRPKIHPWVNSDWSVFFNNLPPEFFEEKYEIVTKLINLGVEVQKTYKDDCRGMSEQLISLNDTPNELRKIIVDNHKVYSGGGSSSSGPSYWWILWVIVMVVRLATSDSCKSNSGPKYDFQNFRVPAYKYDTSGLRKILGMDSIDIPTIKVEEMKPVEITPKKKRSSE